MYFIADLWFYLLNTDADFVNLALQVRVRKVELRKLRGAAAKGAGKAGGK